MKPAFQTLPKSTPNSTRTPRMDEATTRLLAPAPPKAVARRSPRAGGVAALAGVAASGPIRGGQAPLKIVAPGDISYDAPKVALGEGGSGVVYRSGLDCPRCGAALWGTKSPACAFARARRSATVPDARGFGGGGICGLFAPVA